MCIRDRPITLARHAYGDVYRNTELQVAAGSKAELVVTDAQGNETRALIHQFKGGGVVQGMHNLDGSITSFARVCFDYALDTKQDLWFATKDTISKKYDHRFKDIFQEIFDEEYKERFEAAGLEYFYTLIDDAVSRVIRSRGGFIWACKNYDGDVMSDMVATAFGSLGMIDVYKRQPISRIVRESTCDETVRAIRLGIFALISPVITSTEGRCVAITRCIDVYKRQPSGLLLLKYLALGNGATLRQISQYFINPLP